MKEANFSFRKESILNNKTNLLSIGEMAKFTGVHIKSLRYYEQIKILIPAYVDPDTGYRYYSLDQTHMVDFIISCIELDIPLKELTKYTDADNIVDMRAFLIRGREIANKKLKTLKRVMKSISKIEKMMDLMEAYPNSQIYRREFSEKILYTKPYEQSLENIAPTNIAGFFLEMPYTEADYSAKDDIPEYGFLYEFSPLLPNGVQRNIFIEVPKRKFTHDSNAKIIPAGTFYCIQSNDFYLIEQAGDVFKETLAGRNSFMAIQSGIFLGKYKIDNPVNELRLVITPN